MEEIKQILSNKIHKSQIKPGDHIYSWRTAWLYAHHGIYVGDEKVIHFTRGGGQEIGTGTVLDRILVSSSPSNSGDPCLKCGDQSNADGVISSCLDCFLSGGDLYLFRYSVSPTTFLAKARGGTCTLAKSDPPQDVVHRAQFLLENGFGGYNIFKNNCEDFAIYCKTGILVFTTISDGPSGQAATFFAFTRAVFSSSPLRYMTSSFPGLAVVGCGIYCVSRYLADIGMRRDVIKISVEELVCCLRLAQAWVEEPKVAQAPVATAIGGRSSSTSFRNSQRGRSNSTPVLFSNQQHQSFLMDETENARVRWTDVMTECFLKICIEEVNKVGRNGGSLRKETWAIVSTKMNELCGKKLHQKQLKNQYDYLKGKYSGWVYLKNKTGNIYDPVMNMFNLSNQEWEDFFKGHPKARTLKTSPLLFPDLCTALFEGTSATGHRAYSASATRERIAISSCSSFTSRIRTTQDEEGEDDDDEEEQNVAPSSHHVSSVDPSTVTPSPHSSRPNKNGRTKVDLDGLAMEVQSVLTRLVPREPPVVTQGPTVLERCIEKLNTLGLPERDPLYQAAIDIFGHTNLLRETWLIISSDPDMLKDWIKRTAKIHGFM